MQNYDVDGIQFDDYFYPTTDEAFDTESYARYGGGQDLAEWRRANVNTLVQKVYAAVKAVKPEAVFGISPQGNNDNNYSQQYSDVALWLSTPGLCGLHHAAGLLGLQLYAAEWLGPVRVREYRGRMAGHAPGRFGFAGIRAGRIPYRRGGRLRHRERGVGQRPYLADMARTLSVRGADGYALYRYASLYSGGEYAALMQAECAALAQANGIGQTEP